MVYELYHNKVSFFKKQIFQDPTKPIIKVLFGSGFIWFCFVFLAHWQETSLKGRQTLDPYPLQVLR